MKTYTKAERDWIDTLAANCACASHDPREVTTSEVASFFDLAQAMLAESIKRYGPLEPERGEQGDKS